MPKSPGIWIALILLAIVLFGAKRLPDAAKSIGQSIKAFRSEMEPDDADDSKDPKTGSLDSNKP
jgi:sec-independent protein translocase protein TatA